MLPNELAEVNEALNHVVVRLHIHQISPMYWSLDPERVVDSIVSTVEAEYADWERVYDLAVEDMQQWREKSEVYRIQRNRLFQVLKSALQTGVITSAETSALLRMMGSFSGSDVSSVERPLLES